MKPLVPFLALFLVLALSNAVAATPRGTAPAQHIVPEPASVRLGDPSCVGPLAGDVEGALDGRFLRDLVPGSRQIVMDRWSALGIHPRKTRHVNVKITIHTIFAEPRHVDATHQAYSLRVKTDEIAIVGQSTAGLFYSLVTLAQLAQLTADGSWRIPCIEIEDKPALDWRILSDDVSRGPLPTLKYFKERIRTIAAFKMNGYSPYIEHVFVDPKHPLPAPLDGITPMELRELQVYAARFHVALIPEQQTFAHMHNTLRWERYAPLAELPHGYLISPSAPNGEQYVRDLIDDELSSLGWRPPFFHVGSDEPSDLGRGRARALVEASGEGPVFAKHVVDIAKYVQAKSRSKKTRKNSTCIDDCEPEFLTRPMIWDDALAAHPELFKLLPKQLVFVNWHYGNEKTYQPYIDRIAKGGFEQMVAPGALNWNEIYPDLDQALPNIGRFIGEGKRSHVLGLFQTVWHDDGETLFEATWYPVIYAAASAWESGDVDRTRFARDFPSAFFGVDDQRYAADFAGLGKARRLLRASPREYGDYLFWSDPFDASFAGIGKALDLPAIRLAVEPAIEHLRLAPPPPLHANAAAVMHLAARRYDTLARNFQIASEARYYYDDARANADGKHDNYVFRGLFISKYLLWEMRDSMLELEPLTRRAWEYENRASHEASVLERYHLAAQRAIERADRINAATYSGYVDRKALPAFDEALGLTPAR